MTRLSCSDVNPSLSAASSMMTDKPDNEKGGVTLDQGQMSKTTRGRCFKVAITAFPAIIWVLYLCGGAWMFSSIEGPQLMLHRQAEREYFTDLVIEAWERGRRCNITANSYAMLNSSNITDCQIDDIADFIVRDIHQDKGLEWNFLGGFHFCLTVVSTIGYGILVPRTDAGRLLCALYAIIGIPLNITLIGWLGRGVVFCITRLYQFLHNLRTSCREKRGRRVDVRPPRSVSTLSIIGATRINATKHDKCHHNTEKAKNKRDHSFINGAVEHSDSDTEVQMNGSNQVAFRPRHNGMLLTTNNSGVKLSGNNRTDSSEGGDSHSERDWGHAPQERVTHSSQMKSLVNGQILHGDHGSSMSDSTIVGVEDDGPVVSDNESNEKISNNNSNNSDRGDSPSGDRETGVPIWFVALFFALYLCFTTLMIYYSNFVPMNWSVVDSFYFDIITILTVGFGDMFYYTRGQTLTQHQKTSATVVSITMMILGMLMLSAFLSFAVESFTLNNAKNCFDNVFVKCWERLFCRKRKRKKDKPTR